MLCKDERRRKRTDEFSSKKILEIKKKKQIPNPKYTHTALLFQTIFDTD